MLKQTIGAILSETRCAACAGPFIGRGTTQASRHSRSDPVRNGAACFFCPDCLDLLFAQATVFCQFCVTPVEADTVDENHTENPYARPAPSSCPSCPTQPRIWKAGIVFGIYKDFLRNLILRLKFGRDLALCHALGNILALKVEAALCAIDLIVPVPLHDSKLNERGFNQSQELARPIARRLRLPLEHTALRRLRKTASQSGLDYNARMKNMSGAFKADPSKLKGATVLLVDDVFTTGTTITSAAAELSNAGAENILIACLARTPRER